VPDGGLHRTDRTATWHPTAALARSGDSYEPVRVSALLGIDVVEFAGRIAWPRVDDIG